MHSWLLTTSTAYVGHRSPGGFLREQCSLLRQGPLPGRGVLTNNALRTRGVGRVFILFPYSLFSHLLLV